MTDITKIFVVAIVAYLIGSFPTGFVVVKLFKGEDIRKIGSGSTGATNVKRVLGKVWFFIVLLLDALKGFLPVWYVKSHTYTYIEWGLLPVIAAIFVVIGHSKSIFISFKGGKSVATGIGTILALYWPVGLITAAIWAVITYISKYVSLGSIIALAFTPVLMMLFAQPVFFTAYCALGAAYVIYLHRENIKRLIEGNENKVRD